MLELILRIAAIGLIAGGLFSGTFVLTDLNRYSAASAALQSSIFQALRADVVDTALLIGLGLVCWTMATILNETYQVREGVKDHYDDHPKMSKALLDPDE